MDEQNTVQEQNAAQEQNVDSERQGGAPETEGQRPYKGKVSYYICAGAALGVAAGWLIALAAGINGWGGVIAGAIAGAAIGLYVVETKRF